MLREEARQCLTLCGCQPAVKSRGINLLSIDGGGTRGMMGLEVLEQLEQESGKRICELFDYVIGVSTGSIIASLLVAKGYTIEECRTVYMDVSKRLFSQNRLTGVSGIVLNHSYYDTKKWVKMLKEVIGEDSTLIETSKSCIPRLAIVASIVNSPVLQVRFLSVDHMSFETMSHLLVEILIILAILRISCGRLYRLSLLLHRYISKKLNSEIFCSKMVGLIAIFKVIANNPTAIGVHEAKLLWPDERFHCVVSVGNGRSVCYLDSEEAETPANLGPLEKFNRIIDSATDTEGVHMCMHDLLDQNVYYRLNPYVTFPYGLDEIDPKRLEQMQNDAKLYVRRNSTKIKEAASRLLEVVIFFSFFCLSVRLMICLRHKSGEKDGNVKAKINTVLFRQNFE
ncbi:phospholipase, patatin family [Oesophagostomum dentatum]|uniref:Phospholipase, patatin family n=2 Tax=Oesophagostomum dentatum TaxID=61180 RepID=A0A0B1RZ12_OESDE|nr:phospholipase, patatin family [Oesophagostomum dentatum]